VTFEAGRGAPPSATLPHLISLHTHADEGVCHFSGTATYRCRFAAAAISGAPRVCLDLGRIANLAEVTLNGRLLGVVWKPPYRLEIPPGVLAAENALEVAVATTWRNRMVADYRLPAAQRIAQAPLYRWEIMKGKPLVESGLLGPVTLQTASAAEEK
jgi:hypothetical protein